MAEVLKLIAGGRSDRWTANAIVYACIFKGNQDKIIDGSNFFFEGKKVLSFQVANRLDRDEMTFSQVCSHSLE